jgi:predicted ester cyclase
MWNGSFDAATHIITPDCSVHQAPFGSEQAPEYHGPEGLIEMVMQGRAPFNNITVSIEVGPISDGDLIVGRWVFRGTYQGGLPGAAAPVGTKIEFRGIDICRIESGRIAEYWVSSDGAHLMAQLGY